VYSAHLVQLSTDWHQCESQVVVILACSLLQYVVCLAKKCLSCQYQSLHFYLFLVVGTVGWTGCMTVLK
jgi:hypothetical protein